MRRFSYYVRAGILLGVVALPVVVALPLAAAGAGGDAERQFDVLFGLEYKRVKSTPDYRDDVKLAAEMLGALGKVQGGAELKVLLCERAYELGLRHPSGHATAAKAAEALLEADPARESEWREKLLKVYQLQYTMARGPARLAAGEKLLSQFVGVGDTCAAGGDWTEADAAYRKALGVATALRSARRGAILKKIQEAKAGREQAAKIALLKARLAKDASDTAARAALIRHYLIDRNDPAEAAKLAGADTDQAMRTYLPLAAQPATALKPAACWELSRWYQGLIEADPPSEAAREALQRRLQGYYQRFLAGAKTQTAAHIKAKLELDKINRALAAARVRPADTSHLRGAVLVMTFNADTFFEKSGRTCVRDLSGQGNHGVMLKAKQVRGRVAGGVAFDGINSEIVVGNSRSLETTVDQTISVWIYPERFGGNTAICGKSHHGEGAMLLAYNGEVRTAYGPGNEPRRTMTGTIRTIPRRKWTHVAVVRELRRSRIRWYVNGALCKEWSPIQYRTIRPTPSNFRIGKGVSPVEPLEPFKGRLDELAVFARALSAAEVKKLYTLGKQGKSLR